MAHKRFEAFARLQRSELFMLVTIISLAVAPSILLGEGNRNLGLIAFMFACPVSAFYFLKKGRVSFDVILILLFATSITIFPSLFHHGIRWSTIFYSLLFCALFVSYDCMLRRGRIDVARFKSLARFLIIAYTAVLLIQQLCVLLGLPIFNLSNYDPNNPWKLNSLSSEPSHSARIVGLLMVSFLAAGKIERRLGGEKIKSRETNYFVWLCFFWTQITMGSAVSALMIIFTILTSFEKITLKNISFVFFAATTFMFFFPGELFVRVTNLVLAVMTLDYEKVLSADHSGAMRVAPMLVLLDEVKVFSLTGLFGNGIDSVSLMMSRYIWGVYEGFSGGGMLSLWYEYGFISFALFSFFSLSATDAFRKPLYFFLWCLTIFTAGVNTQIVWLAIVLLSSLKHFSRQAKFA